MSDHATDPEAVRTIDVVLVVPLKAATGETVGEKTGGARFHVTGTADDYEGRVARMRFTVNHGDKAYASNVPVPLDLDADQLVITHPGLVVEPVSKALATVVRDENGAISGVWKDVY